MNRLLTSVTLALTVGVVTGGARQEPQNPTYRGTSDTVRVYVTVMDRDGRLVTSLTKDQFEARDDGKPQPIVVFDNSPQPIQIVVLLDISGSMHGNLSLLRQSSMKLFGELGPHDVAKVGTFGRDIVISPRFTRDIDELEAALPDHIPESAPTPLWRAVDEGIDAFEADDRRRIVLVLTDGKDSGPMGFGKRSVSQAEVIDHARDEDVMVYAVGMRSRGSAPHMGFGPGGFSAAVSGDLPDPGLAKTAEATGGGYAEVRQRDDLGEAFSRIARELHSQYLLGYEPPKRDGKTHKIEVRLVDRNLEPRARKTYVAPNGK